MLNALTEFANVMLRGEVPSFAVPILYLGNVCGLQKGEGGIWLVAVGSTFRRLATKIGDRDLMTALGNELRPVQLCVSTRGGCEDVTHAERQFIRDCSHRRVLLKVDMRNAFNCLRRNSFLSVARTRQRGCIDYSGKPTPRHQDCFLARKGLLPKLASNKETHLVLLCLP